MLFSHTGKTMGNGTKYNGPSQIYFFHIDYLFLLSQEIKTRSNDLPMEPQHVLSKTEIKM